MKKIILSAAVAAMAFSTSAMAADKGIDLNVGGQAVVYYQSVDTDGTDSSFFKKENSTANVGIQLNVGADLGNNFTFGSQLTYLGTAGLEKNLVGGVNQGLYGSIDNADNTSNDTTNDIALTKIFLAKQIGNTTLKIGRQELPKSLSPLAYSEGWNVYKNTFDAIVAINTDIPNTTLVGAYVSGGTGMSMDDTGDLLNGAVAGEAYMITASTTAIPMTTLTASYYELKHALGNHTAVAGTEVDVLGGIDGVNVDAYWIDAKIGKDLPMGLNIGLQYGNLDPDTQDDTTAWGVKVSAKPIDALTVCAAYTDVDDGFLGVRNTGTGIKTPLFTQMIGNQDYIAHSNDTMMLKLAYSLGDMGTVILQGTETDDDSALENDVTDIEVAYKVKAGGVNYFAGYVNRDKDAQADDQILRVWARYNF